MVEHVYGNMSTARDESQFLAWLLKLIGGKKVIEVGVFLGATTLTIAQVSIQLYYTCNVINILYHRLCLRTVK